MRSGKANSISAETLIAAAAHGELNESLARQLYRHGLEVVTLALLAANKRIAELQKRCGQQQTTPSTPSAMVPVYAQPNASKRRKRPGARTGHPGTAPGGRGFGIRSVARMILVTARAGEHQQPRHAHRNQTCLCNWTFTIGLRVTP